MSAYKVQSDDCQVILFFANADGRLTICIRRPPPPGSARVGGVSPPAMGERAEKLEPKRQGMFNPPFKYTQTCELNNRERLQVPVPGLAEDDIFRECGRKAHDLYSSSPAASYQHCTKPSRTTGSPRPHPPAAGQATQRHRGEGPPSLAASDEPAAVQAHPPMQQRGRLGKRRRA